MTTRLQDSPTTRREMLSQMLHQFTGDILVDAAKCNGCLDCVAACQRKMAPQHSQVAPVARIAIRSADGLNIPLLCHNCAEAPCAVACMTACRIRAESGWVETDYARCVGCWMCVMACPFGVIVPVYEEELARKCDGCVEDATPACVAACKPGALRRGGQYDFTQERRERFGSLIVL
ncbi:MAG: 4Fe-4S binding protein [Chloroflexota bacterium]|nr:4Fe-4S binding protein [Chloroflexota bacterium]